jgi:hypothetical protein
LSSNHTQINIDHQRTNKENYYKCQPDLIVIGAGLDRISLLFKRMEEKLNATASSDTSVHLPLYSLHRGSLCKLKNAVQPHPIFAFVSGRFLQNTKFLVIYNAHLT